MPDKDIVSDLNDLISTCRDSEEGFGKAAKGVHDDRLRDVLTTDARVHADWADELARWVGQLGAHAAATPHWGGILHRGWVDLETRIRPKDDPSILEECERGEQTTIKHYDHALECELPEEVRAVVERQRADVDNWVKRLHVLQSTT
jgi:uncharacterized protein (TIGR02284 family)